MLSVKIWGNLGDQLFQYALAVHLERINHEKVDFDYQEFSFFQRHFEVAQELIQLFSLAERPRPSVRKPRLRALFKGLLIRFFFKYVHFPLGAAPESAKEAMNEIRKRRFAAVERYEGHFRSESFFKSSRAEILRKFSLAQTLSSEAHQKLAQTVQETESVGLHLLSAPWWVRGPKLESAAGWPSIVPAEYFREAIAKIKSQKPSSRFFVFTDDADWCLALLPETSEMTFVPLFSETSLASLYLLSLCKHQILSPTSFGWWGGWLNRNPDKTVICSKEYWKIGATSSELMWPSDWMRLDRL